MIFRKILEFLASLLAELLQSEVQQRLKAERVQGQSTSSADAESEAEPDEDPSVEDR